MPLQEADDFDRYIEEYDTEISTDFGTKIEWAEGVVFAGTFDGYRTVRFEGEDIEAAEFHDDSEKFWSWQPFQLESALRNIKPGTEVLIRCDGEDPDAPHKAKNKQLAFTVRTRG